MHISHIAIWTTRLEELRNFYITYFNGTSNEKYINPKKGFESYFISFDQGFASLEIMQRQDITTPALKDCLGLAHFSFSVGSKEAVLELTEQLRKDGFVIESEPRTTGDGYFESAILDPEGNIVEITINAPCKCRYITELDVLFTRIDIAVIHQDFLNLEIFQSVTDISLCIPRLLFHKRQKLDCPIIPNDDFSLSRTESKHIVLFQLFHMIFIKAKKWLSHGEGYRPLLAIHLLHR